jgi:hypothetical protein
MDKSSTTPSTLTKRPLGRFFSSRRALGLLDTG